MKLEEQVKKIKNKINSSFEKQFTIIGVKLKGIDASTNYKLKQLLKNLEKETGSYELARKKALEEFTFTLFNRIAAIKVMEMRQIIPEVIIQRVGNGDRSFAHKLWLEQNAALGIEEFEGLEAFIIYWFKHLSEEINLYSSAYLYHLIPDALDLKEIIDLFNEIDEEEWKSDDIMGWLYESYNKTELRAFKESEAKIEFDKVSLTSQVYTPKWVVKFLVDNSLGKLYLEMYPNSVLKDRYKIANAPTKQVRTPKKIEEIKLIDPAPGSGNFLLYAFDLFYDMYIDQGYDEEKIPKYIIENNLHGIDIDDRAIQIAQLGLYIKAKEKNRNIKIDKFNIVSSDFYLPEYEEVKDIFELDNSLDATGIKIIHDVWSDLRNANKFGSLIHIEGRISSQIQKLKENIKDDLFKEHHEDIFEAFQRDFFIRLKKSVSDQSSDSSLSFIKSKTIDSITFLELLTQKYDIAVANPPYTDSSNYGTELKMFVESNYKEPYSFYPNLYACFIKRCYDLTEIDGKIGMIHPMTFMYIKSFENVREFILDKAHISLFVEYGLSNLFGAVMVDPALYILEKTINTNNESLFISLDQYTRTPEEKYKKEYCINALSDYCGIIPNKHNYTLPQSKLKDIKSYPFIYWISDDFRKKFKEKSLDNYLEIVSGLGTGNNIQFIRFWWEVSVSNITEDIVNNPKKWVRYAKGGESNKWYGNLWLVVNWDNDGEEIKNCIDENGRQRSRPQNTRYYFIEGITCSGRSSSKGMSYRQLPNNHIFDVGATGIIPKKGQSNFYSLGYLNSKIVLYIINCLNPTVNTSEGDVRRIPFVVPSDVQKNIVEALTELNVKIKHSLCEYSIIEPKYKANPLVAGQSIVYKSDLNQILREYFNFENLLLCLTLLNESIINEVIFEVYNLSPKDKEMILLKEGEPIGNLPVIEEARIEYLIEIEKFFNKKPGFSKNYEMAISHVNSLPSKKVTDGKTKELKELFTTLYQSNNDLEEFCIKQNENPINIWYLFKKTNVIPLQRAQTIAMELLVDFIREILMEDDDGIVPNVSIPGERGLSELVEEKFFKKGFTSAQYSNFSSILGRDINNYLDNCFFKDLSDHLNLFMYLPKTPFIWHLSSGENSGFEVYIIIYKWSKDTMFKLKSYYVDKRESSLKNRLIDLSREITPQSLNEIDLIKKQLDEIEKFKKNIDAILASGYDPKLDDGVGKNIAPLQEKKMLKYEVLNKGQLKKYLNADW